MNRRAALAALGTLYGTTVAGCLGTDEDGTGNDDSGEREDDDRGTADLDDETIELAERMAAAVDEELAVREWRFSGTQYIITFIDDGGPDGSIPVLGDAYADVVDDGFDHHTMPTAFNDETVEYMFTITPDLARRFLDGEWSEDEYHEAIAETIH